MEMPSCSSLLRMRSLFGEMVQDGLPQEAKRQAAVGQGHNYKSCDGSAFLTLISRRTTIDSTSLPREPPQEMLSGTPPSSQIFGPRLGIGSHALFRCPVNGDSPTSLKLCKMHPVKLCRRLSCRL